MAATSTAFAAAGACAAVAATASGEASRLSSRNAFGTSSMVQFAPLRSKRSNRVVAARAALSEDSKGIQKDVIVSILAAGAALSFSASVVDGAFANPIDVARNKATTTLNSAKNAASALPSAPNPGGAIEEGKKSVENVASGITDRVDGVFGKDRAGPLGKNKVASTNGGTGSALGDAKQRILNFGKNPIAEQIEKSTEKTTENIASASPKPNSQRVDEATDKVEKLGSDLENKGKNAISEGKSFFGGNAQGSIPQFPDLFPKLPETPDLPMPDTSKLEGLKSGAQSKVEEAKSFAESAISQ